MYLVFFKWGGGWGVGVFLFDEVVFMFECCVFLGIFVV